MSTRRALLSMTLVSFFACTLQAQVQNDFDVNKLNGSWKPVSGEFGGQPLPEEAIKAMTLKIEDGSKYAVETGGIVDSGKLTFDSAQSPMHITIIGEEGPNKGRTIVAIFKLSDDRLTICYNIGEDDRPTEFKTPANSQVLLIEYERAR